MEAPPGRYARTDDGVNLAYYTVGDGPDLLWMNPWWSNVESDWRLDETRRLYSRLARDWRLIRFDFRNGGASDRVSDYQMSLDGQRHDVLTVLDAVGSETAVVQSNLPAMASAIALAALNPERVTGLVLWNPQVQTTMRSSLLALDAVKEVNEPLWAKTLAFWLGWRSAKGLSEIARMRLDGSLINPAIEEITRTRGVELALESASLAAEVDVPVLVLGADNEWVRRGSPFDRSPA